MIDVDLEPFDRRRIVERLNIGRQHGQWRPQLMRCVCVELPLALETFLEAVKDFVQRKDAGQDLLWNIVGRKPYVGIGRPDRPRNDGYLPERSKASIDDPQADADQHE